MSSLATPTVWRTALTIANLFTAAYMTARARALEHGMGTVRLLSQRDHLYTEAALLERELEIFRSMRSRKPPRERVHDSPEERGQILMLMRLRHWSAKRAAERFGVHPNTIRSWLKAVDDDLDGQRRIGAPPWNKLHESVRWLVHEIRRLCPEHEFGTRTIARHIIRVGIQISRSSVRRILLEEVTRPKRPGKQFVGRAPDHILHPMAPHCVWHLYVTELRVLWLKVEIAVLLDGFTRKIVANKAFRRRPRTDDLVAMVAVAIQVNAVKPRFLITDNGAQFKGRFGDAIGELGPKHIRTTKGTWQLNAKLERVNRSIKGWARRAMLVPSIPTIQQRLDAYAEWHNRFRPRAAHGSLTPCEVEASIEPHAPVRFEQNSEIQPVIRVRRMSVRGDPRLAYMRITVRQTLKRAA